MGLVIKGSGGKYWNGNHLYNADGTPCFSAEEKLMQERKKEREERKRKFSGF